MNYSPDWSAEEVADFLETLGLGSYHDVFIENDICGECLPLLTEEHLKELQLKSIGHRITFMQYLQSIKKPAKSPIRKSTPKEIPNDDYPPLKRSVSRQNDYNDYPNLRGSQQNDDYQDRSSKSQTPTNDEDDDDSSRASSWEKKRRAAVMKRMNEDKGKRHIQQPEMNFGTNDDNGGLFGAPPPVKGKKQTDYGDDEEDKQPFKANPNPFSREDADLDYPPPKPKPKPVKKVSNPPRQPKRPEPEPEPEPEPSFPQNNDRDDDYFAQFGEDDVPPMGGSKLGGQSQKPAQKQSSYEPPARSSAPPPPSEDDPNDNRVECLICHRKFAEDRIDRHMQACKTSNSRKKKVFDSAKMRNADNDAMQYQGRSETPPKVKKSNYKEQHEQLVANLKAARAATEYEKAKAEGKAVGPPPKMPEYKLPDDDRVECPYCGRKFGSNAAQRHIPFCEKSHAGKKLNDKGGKPGTTKKGGRW